MKTVIVAGAIGAIIYSGGTPLVQAWCEQGASYPDRCGVIGEAPEGLARVLVNSSTAGATDTIADPNTGQEYLVVPPVRVGHQQITTKSTDCSSSAAAVFGTSNPVFWIENELSPSFRVRHQEIALIATDYHCYQVRTG